MTNELLGAGLFESPTHQDLGQVRAVFDSGIVVSRRLCIGNSKRSSIGD
jgi:hypothetical protein